MVSPVSFDVSEIVLAAVSPTQNKDVVELALHSIADSDPEGDPLAFRFGHETLCTFLSASSIAC